MAQRSILALVERVADVVAALSLLSVALVTAATVVLRALGANLPDSIDLSSFLMGIMVFWAMAVAFRHDDNVRVEFAASLGPPVLRRAVRAFANLTTAGFVVLLAVAGERQLGLVYRSQEVTPELRLDLWPFAAVAWVGLALAALAAVGVAFGWFAAGPRGAGSQQALGPANKGASHAE